MAHPDSENVRALDPRAEAAAEHRRTWLRATCATPPWPSTRGPSRGVWAASCASSAVTRVPRRGRGLHSGLLQHGAPAP